MAPLPPSWSLKTIVYRPSSRQGHKGLPFGHQGLPFGHQGLPFDHQGPLFDHQGHMVAILFYLKLSETVKL